MRRKKKKNYAGIMVSLFIALILVTSIVGFIFGGTSETVSRYNGLKFTLTTNGWKTIYQGKTYLFSFAPRDVEDIALPDSLNLNNLLEIDVTYEFNSTYKENIAEAIFELSNIATKNNIYLRQGFTTNNSFNIPIITCEDATPSVPVLYYKSSNQTNISQQNNCIIIEANNQNLFLAQTDRIAYKILGIMD